MDRNNPYYHQVALLLRVLPFVAEERCFALKGGTAINLFVRDFPRLSVDIDLVYLGDDSRDAALNAVAEALDRIADAIETALPDVEITRVYQGKADALRLIVSEGGSTVKIELSPVLRGTVYPVDERAVVQPVEDEFGFAEIQVVSHPDLYAGKICAALDRQHPRDFFDVSQLLENEGISDELRKAFIVYLASHNRPVEELIDPKWKEISEPFKAEFQGMTFSEVTAEELLEAVQEAHKLLIGGLTEAEKRVICGLYDGGTDWDLIGLSGVEELPAVRWKVSNINKMDSNKRQDSLKALRRILGLDNDTE